MIDFNLKVFITVAKMNSFTKAAELLNLSQPAVTHQIKSLENTLGTKLFARLQNRISLTRSGEILLKYAQQIDSLYDQAMKEIQNINNRVAGEVHLGAASLLGKYLLPRIIGEFKKTYPEVGISMLVGNSKEILQYLRNDAVELAIVSEPVTLRNTVAIPLYRDHLTAIVYPDHPWTLRKKITVDDLFAEDFISREVGSGTREVYLRALNTVSKGRRLRTAMVLGSTEAVKMAVIGRMGFSIVSRLATRPEVELGLLKEIPVDGMGMSRDFFLVYKSEENLSVAASKLKEYLIKTRIEFKRYGIAPLEAGNRPSGDSGGRRS